MKKRIYSLLLAGLVLSAGVNAQVMRVGVRGGSAPNTVIVTVMPNFNFSAKLVEMGFSLMVPKESPPGTPITMPTVTVVSTCGSCANGSLPPLSWVQVSDAISDPNFYLIKLGCVNPNIGTSPLINIANGASQDIVELRFTGSTVTPTQIRLAHLGNGGPGFQYGVSIYDDTPPPGNSDRVNYMQIFYGAGVEPALPYPDEGTGYSNTQFVPISNIVLPINWLSFDAVRSGNNGLLTWKVSNEESNERYELQRSLNGIDYSPIASIVKSGSGNSVMSYNYTDVGIDALGSAVIYYRLKQINIDGRSSLSEVRILKLGKGNGEITVFPNPVKQGFYVNVPLGANERSPVTLSLITLSGQLVTTKEITPMQASNYYFDVRGLALAAGQYNIQVIQDGKLLGSKKILVTQ